MLTIIDEFVDPLLHKYVQFVAPDVSVTFPLQKVVGPDGLIILLGEAFTVTAVPVDAFVQPPLCVTVTVYVPAVFTLIDCVVAPVDHK